MATLRLLARHLGLAPSTVSRAFTGRHPVATATRARVLAAAQALGYGRLQAADPAGRPTLLLALRARHADGMLGRRYLQALATGLAEGVAALGGRLAVASGDGDADPAGLARQAGVRPAGTILWGWWRGEDLARFAAAGPCVSLSAVPPGCGMAEVNIDYEHGLDLLVRHLRRLGHRRIGVLYGRQATLRGPERAGAALAALLAAGGAARDLLVLDAGTPGALAATVRAARTGTRAWIAVWPGLARRLQEALAGAGLEVPADCSLATFLPPGEAPDPAGPCGIQGPFQAIGRAAAGLLLGPRERLRTAGRLLLPGVLHPGGSTAAAQPPARSRWRPRP